MFEKAGRQELVDEVVYEMQLLASYLPAAVSEEEIKAGVLEVKATLGNNFGAVMKEVMGRFKGRAEGNVVSRIVKEVLESN